MSAPRRLDYYARKLTPWERRYYLRAEKRHLEGNTLKAFDDYTRLIARNGKCWPAVFNLAVLLHWQGIHDEAIGLLERMVRHEPRSIDAWFNLGTIQQSAGDYTGAAVSLARAVELDPDHASSRINYGNALLALGRREEADVHYQAALALTPYSDQAVWNRAHYLVLTGQWEEGWRCYEARWGLPGFRELNQVQVPDEPGYPVPWRGQPLSGCTIVVAGEQGHGDDLMCLRYASTLRARGARTIWALRPTMLRLAALAVAPDEVIDIHGPMPKATYLVSTMSLHHYLGTTPDNVPHPEGYLKAAA